MSERDLELIHAMQDAPRASWEMLAERLQVGPDKLSQRWDRLVTARLAWAVIYPGRGWWDHPDHQLGWVETTVTPPDTVAAVAARLASDSSVMSVDAGPGSVLASVISRGYTSMGQDLLAGRYGPASIHWAIQLHTNASRWRVGALSDHGATTADRASRHLDDDRVRALLRVLGPHPRLPARQVADACGISDWTAREWIRRTLAAEDLAMRCEVVRSAVVRPVSMHWWMRVPDSQHDDLVDVLLRQPDVRWVATVEGTTDATLLAALWLRDLAAGRPLAGLVARVAPGAATSKRAYDLCSIKRLGWLIDDHGRRGEYVPLDI